MPGQGAAEKARLVTVAAPLDASAVESRAARRVVGPQGAVVAVGAPGGGAAEWVWAEPREPRVEVAGS